MVFEAACHDLGETADRAAYVFDTIIAPMYEMPGRHYHTLEHLDKMVTEIMAGAGKKIYVKLNMEEKSLLLIATFFHDLVYFPGGLDNEWMSGVLADRIIETYLGVLRPFQSDIRALIMVTDYTMDPESQQTITHKLIHDADLAQIGHPWKTFEKNGDKLRVEYPLVSDKSYAIESTVFWKRMLREQPLYCLDEFRGKYEKQAQKNMKQAIKK
jgi:predicted metal-dependent HD superfamily phosphohydrolase